MKNYSGERIKEIIADALIRLMKDRPLEQITISDITNCADVGRVTYYRNFNSKEEILQYKLNLDLERWASRHTIPRGDLRARLTRFLRFILSTRDFLELLYKNGLSHILLRCFCTHISPDAETDPESSAKIFTTYGMFGLTDAWIKTGMKQSPEELTGVLLREIHGYKLAAEKN